MLFPVRVPPDFYIERRTQAEGVQEQGSKNKIWAKERRREECRRSCIINGFHD